MGKVGRSGARRRGARLGWGYNAHVVGGRWGVSVVGNGVGVQCGNVGVVVGVGRGPSITVGRGSQSRGRTGNNPWNKVVKWNKPGSMSGGV